MDTEKKLQILADEVFQVDISEISPNTSLHSILSWDSMAALALISVFEEHFYRLDIDGSTIKNFKIIQDILDMMVEI
jgi:acyl carrier protein